MDKVRILEYNQEVGYENVETRIVGVYGNSDLAEKAKEEYISKNGLMCSEELDVVPYTVIKK